MSDEVRTILEGADDMLATAKLGLDDLRGSDPARRRAGFRNAVVFGRTVTFALQNLRGKVDGFDDWYSTKETALRADPTFKKIAEIRNQIEKQAKTPLRSAIRFSNAAGEDLQKAFGKPPPGTTGDRFIGDSEGGSGWIVRGPDGKEEKFYVAMPSALVQHFFNLPGDQPFSKGEDAAAALDRYLKELSAIVAEAQNKFLPPQS